MQIWIVIGVGLCERMNLVRSLGFLFSNCGCLGNIQIPLQFLDACVKKLAWITNPRISASSRFKPHIKAIHNRQHETQIVLNSAHVKEHNPRLFLIRLITRNFINRPKVIMKSNLPNFCA